MTNKILRYIELDAPPFVRTQVRLNLDSSTGNSPNIHTEDSNSVGDDRTWTFHNDAVIDTTKAVDGAGSLKCTTNGYIDTQDSTLIFDLGDSDWTIEFYFWRNEAVGSTRNICGNRNGNGGANSTRAFSILFSTAGKIRASVYQGSTEFQAESTSIFGVSVAWHHVSFQRNGTNLSLYIDGVREVSSDVLDGSINWAENGSIAIGRDGDTTANTLRGWVDEFTIHPYARRGDVTSFTPESASSQDFTVSPSATYRFAQDTSYLPVDIDAVPSLIDVDFSPPTISLGEDLGARTTVTCKFRDHRHIFDDEDFDSGTFWGKFRAIYGLKLRGSDLRVITGTLGQAITDMETRHYVVDSSDGPSAKGEFRIIAKDVLKFADGDRSQAPAPNSGYLLFGINSVDTEIQLLPEGIGDAEYADEGYGLIGGNEIVFFERSGDVVTLDTRGDWNTDAVGHDDGERFQQCLFYDAVSPDVIIADLLTSWAGVDDSFVDTTTWAAEIATYVSVLYTGFIAEPTSVAQLISELIEQVGLVMWWDDVNQQVRLQVLRPIPSTADVFDADVVMADSMTVTEQPDKRLTQVFVYFNQYTPIKSLDQLDNFLSSTFVKDIQAEADYGGEPLIKTIYSRWIPEGGLTIAEQLCETLLSRFTDPPRRIALSLLRGSVGLPSLGGGYQISNWMFQDSTGALAMVPAQVTSLNPGPDVLDLELEEVSDNFIAGGTGGGSSPGEHIIIIDSDTYNIDLQELHDSLYSEAVSGNVIRVTINSNVTIGSTNISSAAFYVGEWNSGVTIIITNHGLIIGAGGRGGDWGQNGQPGGTAFYTRQAITLDNSDGSIYGGGGGGGGGGYFTGLGGSYSSGGGGGAGNYSGAGGTGGPGVSPNPPGVNGSPGNSFAGGAGGVYAGSHNQGLDGGGGGNLGFAGSPGHANNPAVGTISGQGAGGSAGAAIDGDSHITYISHGDTAGALVN